MAVYIPSMEQKPGVWRGGQVYEIVRNPADADYPNGDYRLWAGTATIERSADYSYFANAERLHILLCGDGLRLHFREPEQTVALASHDSHTFSGARPLHAEVLGAPVFAFNLIYRQGLTSGVEFVALVKTPHLHTIHAEAGTACTQIVYVISGTVLLESADDERLMGQGDTLLWELTGPTTQELCFQSQTPNALLLLTFVSNSPTYPTTSA